MFRPSRHPLELAALLIALGLLLYGFVDFVVYLQGPIARTSSSYVYYETYRRELAAGLWPWQRGFTFEYPPLAIFAIFGPFLFAHGMDLSLLHSLKGGLVLGLTLLVAWLWWRGPAGPTAKIVVLLGGAAMIAFVHDMWFGLFDWVPALGGVAGGTLLARGRTRGGLAIYVLGGFLKIVPLIAAAPLLLGWRDPGVRSARRLFAGLLALHVAYAAIFSAGAIYFLQYFKNRPPDVYSFPSFLYALAHRDGSFFSSMEWLFGSYNQRPLVVTKIGSFGTLATLLGFGALALLVRRSGRRDLGTLLLTGEAALMIFMVLGKIHQHNYVFWTIPVVATLSLYDGESSRRNLGRFAALVALGAFAMLSGGPFFRHTIPDADVGMYLFTVGGRLFVEVALTVDVVLTLWRRVTDPRTLSEPALPSGTILSE